VKRERRQILHIAIVRKDLKNQMTFIKKFVESEEGKELLEHKATGTFFKVENGTGYGEYPLAFALCTNQLKVFDYLVEKGASLDFKTDEGYNILHHLVLQSCPPKKKPPEDHVDDEDCAWCRKAWDHVQEKLEQLRSSKGKKSLYDELFDQAAHDCHTPLTLCAARGTLNMFKHLFEKRLKLQWSFGPVIDPHPPRATAPRCPSLLCAYADPPAFCKVVCKKLCLEGIDLKGRPQEVEAGSGREVSPRSVLETAVEHQRSDILTEDNMLRILDTKWEKYGKTNFRETLILCVVQLCLQTFVMAIDPDSRPLPDFLPDWSMLNFLPNWSQFMLAILSACEIASLGIYLYSARTHLGLPVLSLLLSLLVSGVCWFRWPENVPCSAQVWWLCWMEQLARTRYSVQPPLLLLTLQQSPEPWNIAAALRAPNTPSRASAGCAEPAVAPGRSGVTPGRTVAPLHL
jgi:ankyrin repeat protein